MNAAQKAAAIVLLAIAAAALPKPGRAAQPVLVDQRGRHFTLRDLRRTPLVVTFVSAHCTQVCPIVNALTADAVRRAGLAGLNVRFLTITLDPEHDSLADMRTIARRFDAEPNEWIVAGGSVTDVHAIMRWFGVVAERGVDAVEAHAALFYIVGTDDRIRNTLLVSGDVDRRIVVAVRAAQGR
jgi:protein SCO1/2